MRGLAVEIKDNRAIILRNDGTFANIKNKNFKVGQKVKTMSKAMGRSLKIAACIALCLITSTVAYKFYYTPYSYLYIDINPSVRLEINYFNRVIGCTPLNEDAEFIKLSTGNVEESVNEVIEKCEERGFLNEENNEIEINVSSDNSAVQKSVAKVENKYQSAGYKVVVKKTTKQETKKANARGISVKRQRVIDEFSTVFGGDTEENVEKLQDKSTKEIGEIIVAEQKNEEKSETVEVQEKEKPIVEEDKQTSTVSKKTTKPKQVPTAVVEKQKNDEPKRENPVKKEEPGKDEPGRPVAKEESKPEQEEPGKDEPGRPAAKEESKPEQEEPPAIKENPGENESGKTEEMAHGKAPEKDIEIKDDHEKPKEEVGKEPDDGDGGLPPQIEVKDETLGDTPSKKEENEPEGNMGEHKENPDKVNVPQERPKSPEKQPEGGNSSQNSSQSASGGKKIKTPPASTGVKNDPQFK